MNNKEKDKYIRKIFKQDQYISDKANDVFNSILKEEFNNIEISDIDISTIKKITLEDIHSYISYTATVLSNKPASRARKVSSIRVFFNYLSQKAKLIENNPAQNLETPKLRETYS